MLRSVFLKWWAYMSCAIWTVLGLWALVFKPNDTKQIHAYFIIAGASLIAAFLQTIYQQHQEIKILKARPPEINLEIHNVVLHRTNKGELKYINAEFLVQASSTLISHQSLKVEYSAQLVFRGEVADLIPLRDLKDWEVVDRQYYQHLGSGISSDFKTNPVPLTQDLEIQRKNEGWLHFRVEGMADSQIAKRVLRLYAISEYGKAHCDENLAKRQVSASSLVVRKKFVERPNET